MSEMQVTCFGKNITLSGSVQDYTFQIIAALKIHETMEGVCYLLTNRSKVKGNKIIIDLSAPFQTDVIELDIQVLKAEVKRTIEVPYNPAEEMVIKVLTELLEGVFSRYRPQVSTRLQ